MHPSLRGRRHNNLRILFLQTQYLVIWMQAGVRRHCDYVAPCSVQCTVISAHCWLPLLIIPSTDIIDCDGDIAVIGSRRRHVRSSEIMGSQDEAVDTDEVASTSRQGMLYPIDLCRRKCTSDLWRELQFLRNGLIFFANFSTVRPI